ncbi:MAG TPA: carbamoyltransferase HypF [bacterium (Candidatus Stahlbacteria)]|nr:carbamoyltransferase HypF [Candidatus Stahlbacteria bacterium]
MLHIKIRGIVQGVGFRPFVFRLARDLGLKGYVFNSSSGVEICVEGENGSIESFLRCLKSELPPVARIDMITSEEMADHGYKDFVIRESEANAGATLISPDLATCDDCISEMKNPVDRRADYPFINCTNCGPRYSIIYKTPYDRINTTMRMFAMCEECNKEYHDPLDRRFHAQPDACPVCGPEVYLVDPSGKRVTEDPIDQARSLLLKGKILGIKGIGGFHIAADSRLDETIKELRRRKRRPHKPFAIMCLSDHLDRIVQAESGEILRSPQSPILLLRKKDDSPISELVAPNNPYLGVFLPYAPIHYLLLNDKLPYLIMTSGNLADEPIAIDENELASLCDFYLTNNRPIANRTDDSIIFPTSLGPTLIRRSRGYVPDPIDLVLETVPTLACGGELKGTFALSKERLLYPSPHLGDLESKKSMDFFKESLARYERWFKIEPELVACDLHPDYLTTRYAESLDLPLIRIQHHHAHIASVLIDNYRNEKVIGIAYDGTGYGEDGKIWGGEILLADFQSCERQYHLRYLPLPGGDAAIKAPRRIAIAYLLAANEDPDLVSSNSFEVNLIRRQVQSGFNIFPTSSMGRLFDCVSAMIGLFDVISFEAQAAMGLEYLAYNIETDKVYQYNLSSMVIDPIPMLREIAQDIRGGFDHRQIARAFHNTIIAFTKEIAVNLSQKTGITTVALSGGVFQNRIILDGIVESLTISGLEVLIHHKLPPNDGCLSAGQVAIANVSRSSR